MRIRGETMLQLLRYAAIGLISNAALYAAYLLLSWSGVGHKTAMTLVYCAGVLATFAFNRRWTFAHGGAISGALLRYAATYAFGYASNVVALLVLVDAAGLPHQWVVLALIFVNAALLFLLQKFWVFSARRADAPG